MKYQITVGIISDSVIHRRITVDVESWTSIEDIKKVIQEREGIPTDQQRMVHRGRPLQDNYTLSDYSIGEGVSICLVRTNKEI